MPKKNSDIKNLRITSFEIKLLVIAILLPLFFDTFPDITKGIIFFPFTFQLPLIISYLFGLNWFLLLLFGIVELAKNKFESPTFDIWFRYITWVTLSVLIFVFSAYLYGILLFKLSVIGTIATFIMLYLFILLVILIKVKKRSNGQ